MPALAIVVALLWSAAVSASAAYPAPQPLLHARTRPQLARLPDGRILAFGGYTGNTDGVVETEIFDPRTGTWTEAGSLGFTRYCAQHVVLRQGRVVEIGGRPYPWGTSASNVEIFDPKPRSWRPASPMPTPRDAFGLIVLKDGRMLATGGYAAVNGKGDAVATSEIYDPRLDAWSSVDDRPEAAWFPFTHLLPDGRVLTAGGSNNGALTSVYLFDPRQDRWSAASPMLNAHEDGQSVELAGGAILAAGGYGNGPDPSRYHPEAERYDAARGEWNTAGSLRRPRQGGALASVGAGAVLLGGTRSGRAYPFSSVEIYDPTSNTWRFGPRLKVPRQSATAIALDATHVLVVGGSDGSRPLDSVEIVDVNGPAQDEPDAPRSNIGAVPRPYVPPAPRRLPPPEFSFSRKGPERPHDFAVVVGVDGYKNLPHADFAENDAREMSSALIALGVPEENIVTLMGARAGLAEITKYVEEWLPRRISPDSRVFFYFSGHGAPDVKDGSAYLMPWDADATFVKSTGIPLTRLYASLGDLPARQVIAMIDSCFSGAGGRSVVSAGLRPLVSVRMPASVPSKISVLTASENEEVAGSLPERGHGLFSYYLLQGLDGAADGTGTGHVTLGALHAYVRKHVILDAREQNREQTPTLISPNPSARLY
jgi:hypothetical protein